MTCYRPITAWQSGFTGRLRFSPPEKNFDAWDELQVPCGKCIGCRMTRAQHWGLRCAHEAQMNEDNCFITLTYRPEDLPEHGSLEPKHLQDFWKRLRTHIDRDLRVKKTIRYFACGEYGDQLQRPHYHACIFGHDFADKKPDRGTKSQYTRYSSETLDRLWTHGRTEVGTLTYESAQYTAGYCTKKITGDLAKRHYGKRKPEFGVMSNGIGRSWYEKYQDDLRNDFLVHETRKFTVPRYYDKLFEADDGDIERLKQIRKERAEANPERQNPDRLAAGEYIATQKASMHKRNFEHD